MLRWLVKWAEVISSGTRWIGKDLWRYYFALSNVDLYHRLYGWNWVWKRVGVCNNVLPWYSDQRGANCVPKKFRCRREDVLAVLPAGFGKSLIYQLLPKVYSSYWLQKYGEQKTFQNVVVSPLEQIRKQQVETCWKRDWSSVSRSVKINTNILHSLQYRQQIF